MEFQPTCCQTSEDPVDGGDGAGGAISDSSPKKRAWMPEPGDRKMLSIETMTTTEMKCGM